MESRSAKARAPGHFSVERGKGLRPFPRTPFLQAASCLRCAPEHQKLDEAEHLHDNRKTSVASLRSAFGFIPESRSPSLRNGVHFQRNPQTGRLDFSLAHDPVVDPIQRAKYWNAAAIVAREELPKVLQQIDETSRALIHGRAS